MEKIEAVTNESVRTTIVSLGKYERQDLRRVFEGEDPILVDFLERVLVIDADYRYMSSLLCQKRSNRKL